MSYFEDEVFDISNISEIESLKGVEFISCEFVNVDLREQDASGAKFIECKFRNSNLSNLKLLGTTLRDVAFDSSKCVGINFSECNSLFDLNFSNSSLDYTSFIDCSLSASRFLSCSFKEADFSQGRFENCDFSYSDFRGANFSRANMKGSNFSNTKNFYIDLTSTSLKGCKFSMPEVLNLLTPFGIEIE